MQPVGNINIRPFKDVDETLKEVFATIDLTYTDPRYKVFDSFTLPQLFNYVKEIPYVPDPHNDAITGYDDIEFVKSFYYTNYFGGDCDDKATAIGTILKRRGIPFRFAVVSTTDNQDLHHIYPEIYLQDPVSKGSMWVPYDATYNYNTPFTEAAFTKKRIYDNNSGQIISYEIKENSPLTHGTFLAAGQQGTTRNMILGNNTPQLAGTAGMGVLRGNANGQPCTTCQSRNYVQQLLNTINQVPVTHFAEAFLLGDGFDVTSIVSAAVSWLSNLFGGTSYVDAYHAYYQAVQQVNNAVSPTAHDLATFASANAMIAVLLKDYMNPPKGANVCTSPDKCGNRADWATIQPAVNQAVAQLTPFFYWCAIQIYDNHVQGFPGFSESGLLSMYADYKSHGSLYAAYQAAVATGNPNAPVQNPATHPVTTNPITSLAGGGLGSILLVVGGACVVYQLVNSKKKKRSAA